VSSGQIRGQYRFGHLALANPGDFSLANEFLFQFLFVMGAHGRTRSSFSAPREKR